jgi:hypothetical protein
LVKGEYTMTKRELDLTILKNVFGVKKVYYKKWDEQKEFDPEYIPSGKPIKTHAIDAEPIPCFSTNAKACYNLKLYMAKKYWWEIRSPFYEGQPWFAGLTPHYTTGWNGEPNNKESGETEMIAVCRSALKASGLSVDNPSLPQEIFYDDSF